MARAATRAGSGILLLITLTLAASLLSCGGTSSRHPRSEATGGEHAVQQQGGLVLRYAAPQASMSNAVRQRVANVLAVRAKALSVSVSSSWHGRELTVYCVACRDAPAAMTDTGRIAVYDWEQSVVGNDGQPHPEDPSVTGGAAAGTPGIGTQTYYDAVTTAAGLAPTHEADDTTNGLLYGVDDESHAIACGPQPTLADVRDACRDEAAAVSRFIRVPRGYVVSRARASDRDAEQLALAQDAYYVLKDDPKLVGGRDLRDAAPAIDHGPGGNGEPVVTFTFTDQGRPAWEALTRAVAKQGMKAMLPGVDSRAVANHLAVVLDGRLVSVPYIDPSANPDGLDASKGSQLSGGFTESSARAVAALINSGPLPVPLMLVGDRRVTPAGTHPKTAASGQKQVPAGSDCPLSTDDVHRAFAMVIPERGPRGSGELKVLCRWSQSASTTDPFAGLSVLTVDVTPFPLPTQPEKTPGALRKELLTLGAQMPAAQRARIVGQISNRPQWGSGAFVEISHHPATSDVPTAYQLAEAWLPRYHITAVLPDSETDVPSAPSVIAALATAAARHG